MCQRAHDPTVLISRRETRLEEMFVCPRPFSPSRAGCAAHVWPTGYVARARLALRSEALRKGAPRLLAGLRTPATQRSTFPFPLSTPLSLYFNTTFNGNHSCQLLISTASNNAFGLPFFSCFCHITGCALIHRIIIASEPSAWESTHTDYQSSHSRAERDSIP